MNMFFGWALFFFAYQSLAGGRFNRFEQVFGAIFVVTFCNSIAIINLSACVDRLSFIGGWRGSTFIFFTLLFILHWAWFTWSERYIYKLNSFNASDRMRKIVSILGALYFLFIMISTTAFAVIC